LTDAASGLNRDELPSGAYVFGTETGELLTRRRVCALWLDTCQRAKATDLLSSVGRRVAFLYLVPIFVSVTGNVALVGGNAGFVDDVTVNVNVPVPESPFSAAEKPYCQLLPALPPSP
jgi:hypothetical protein